MKTYITTFLLILFFKGGLEAQIFSPERIKNRVKTRAEERTASEVDGRIDRGVDKVLDGIFGSIDKGAKAGKDAISKDKSVKKEGDQTSKNEADVEGLLFKALNGMGKGAAPADQYAFDASYTMQMTSKTKKEGVQKIQILYRFPKDNSYFGADLKMEGQRNFMVYDFAKNTMHTFMDMNGQSMYMSIAMNAVEDSFQEQIDQDVDNTTYRKSGQTKNIAGYTCDGYWMKQDDTEMLAWISRAKVPVVSDYYLNMAKASGNGQSPFKVDYHKNPDMLKLMKNGQALLGMDWEEKDETYQLEVIAIETKDPFSLTTSAYKNMLNLGSN